MVAGPLSTRRRRTLVALVAVLLAALAATALVPRGSSQPGLGELWSGHARLQLAHMWSSASLGEAAGGAAGTSIVVADGTWYLFSRHTEPGSCAGYNSPMPPMATQVRASHDRGAHWGAPVTIVAPTPGTRWSCEASDGSATYDPDTQTWRYLFQCRGDGSPWNGCYVERHAKSPLGPFAAPSPDPNPVIASGALWSQICDPGDQCARGPGSAPLVDEGTFDVFDYDGRSWWVGFHGWDGHNAFRGLARTSTFRPDGWKVDGADGTPTDAVLGPRDTAGWRESWHAGGPVGAGAGSVLSEDGWHYQLAEFPDESLGCQAGQNWDLGLFRARSLASTSWQQFPGGNPVVYSSRDPGTSGVVPGCSVEYPDLFRDPGTGVSYVMYRRVSADPAKDGLYLYRVAPDDNLLVNGDFSLGDADGWSRFAATPTQIDVPRTPDRSADGTPFASIGCGAASCVPNSGIYQDVAAAALHGHAVRFSGRFAAPPGTHLRLALVQLAAGGAVLHAATVPIATHGGWALAQGSADVDERAVVLRLQIFLDSPQTVRLDDLSLRRTG